MENGKDKIPPMTSQNRQSEQSDDYQDFKNPLSNFETSANFFKSKLSGISKRQQSQDQQKRMKLQLDQSILRAKLLLKVKQKRQLSSKRQIDLLMDYSNGLNYRRWDQRISLNTNQTEMLVKEAKDENFFIMKY